MDTRTPLLHRPGRNTKNSTELLATSFDNFVITASYGFVVVLYHPCSRPMSGMQYISMLQIHGYELFLVPTFLTMHAAQSKTPLAFFLPTPFPSSEVTAMPRPHALVRVRARTVHLVSYTYVCAGVPDVIDVQKCAVGAAERRSDLLRHVRVHQVSANPNPNPKPSTPAPSASSLHCSERLNHLLIGQLSTKLPTTQSTN